MHRDTAPGARRSEIEVLEPAASLTTEEYGLFAQIGRARRVEAGERLFRRGDLGTTMYVIADGAVDLDFGDDLVAKRLGPREFFGELGLLIGDHARSADAIISAPGTLIELEQREFEQLVDRDPRLLAHFLRRAIMRVVLNERASSRACAAATSTCRPRSTRCARPRTS